jgi:probable O-glycosylation ligase (exosortase A-associated)
MLRTILVISILVPGLFLALNDRFKALILYLWFAFFRPQDWMWLDISMLQPSLVLGLTLAVPAVLNGILPNLSHPLSIGAILFLASSLLSQIYAVNAAVGWSWIDFLARLLLVSLLAVTLITTRSRLMGVIAVVSGSFGFHAAKAGLASMLGGGVRFFDGLSGSFTDNNGYALGTVMMMPLLMATAENLDLLVPADRPAMTRWVRRLLWTMVPLCGMTVISTFSRAGFLALVAATLTYVALHRRRVRLALGVTALVVIGLTFVPLPEGYADRLETIQTYDEIGEESAISRPHFWQVAVLMANAEPFGVGLRNYELAYDKYDFSDGRHGRGRSVHSSHFQVLAELGYLGAVIWITQFTIAFLLAFRVRARARTPGLSPADARLLMTTSTALMTSMVGFLVGGAFIALALNDVTWLSFALVAALDRLSKEICDSVSVPATLQTRPVFAGAPFETWRPNPAAAARRLTP